MGKQALVKYDIVHIPVQMGYSTRYNQSIPVLTQVVIPKYYRDRRRGDHYSDCYMFAAQRMSGHQMKPLKNKFVPGRW